VDFPVSVRRCPRPGWVYIMTHPAWSRIGRNGMVKIGKTTRDPHHRASEIASSSGLLSPCVVAWCAWVSDIDQIEPAVHRLLDRHRVRRRREMFTVDIETARSAILSAERVRFIAAPIPARRQARRSRRRTEGLLLLLLAACLALIWLVSS
jgi:hypothetical protein